MKKESKVLKSSPQIKISVTRDSVCAADDCDASHEKIITTPSFIEPSELAFQIASKYGLPNISGGKAAWVYQFNGINIAVLAQQWSFAKALVSEISYKENNVINFVYHGQKKPEDFF